MFGLALKKNYLLLKFKIKRDENKDKNCDDNDSAFGNGSAGEVTGKSSIG